MLCLLLHCNHAHLEGRSEAMESNVAIPQQMDAGSPPMTSSQNLSGLEQMQISSAVRRFSDPSESSLQQLEPPVLV